MFMKGFIFVFCYLRNFFRFRYIRIFEIDFYFRGVLGWVVVGVICLGGEEYVINYIV